MAYDLGDLVKLGQVKDVLERIGAGALANMELKEVQITLPDGTTETREILVSQYINENMKVLLHFDTNATTDECANTWTAYNNPTIDTVNGKFGSSVRLNENITSKNYSQQQILKSSTFAIEAGDFTLDAWLRICGTNRFALGIILRADKSNVIYTDMNTTDSELLVYYNDGQIQKLI